MARKVLDIFDTARISDDAVRVIGYHGGPDAKLPDKLHGMLVREIGRDAFAGQKELRTITIPEGVETIRAGAFADCVGLETIALPATVTLVEEGAFVRCVGLKRIETAAENSHYRSLDGILFDRRGKVLCCYPAGRQELTYALPVGVNAIAPQAFSWCSALQKVVLTPALEWIGESACAYCVLLQDIDIPHGVAGIDACAFMACGRLTAVRMPGTLTTLGPEAFSGCSQLAQVVVSCMLTRIEDGVFRNCARLPVIELSESLVELGDAAFAGCSSLNGINLPVRLERIGDETFRDCVALRSLEIPPGVKRVGLNAFTGCKHLTVIADKDSAAYQAAKRDHVHRRSTGRALSRL